MQEDLSSIGIQLFRLLAAKLPRTERTVVLTKSKVYIRRNVFVKLLVGEWDNPMPLPNQGLNRQCPYEKSEPKARIFYDDIVCLVLGEVMA